MAPSPFLRTAVLLASSMIALLSGLARAQAGQPLAPEQFTACVQALAAQTHLAGRGDALEVRAVERPGATTTACASPCR